MPPVTTGPTSWLNRTMADLGGQAVQPLLDDLERQRQQAQQPAIVPAQPSLMSSIPSLEALLGGGQQQQGQPQEQQASAPSVGGWLSSIPGLESLLGRQEQPAAPQQAPVATSGTPQAMPTIGGAIAQEPGDLRAWARQEAQRLGIDPDIAEKVAESEGGFDNPVQQSNVINAEGQREQSYGPYQLYVTGGLGNEALARGIDPRKPEHARAAVTFALEHAARNGWGNYHGAARVGIGAWDGIGQAPQQLSPPHGQTTPTQAEQTPAAQAQMPWGTYTAETLTPNQFSEGQAQGLTPDEAIAVCGPAAAVAFSRANGRQPTLREAKELAQNLGLWDQNTGMYGPAAQVKLMENLGVKANLQEGANWGAIAREVMAGRPVIVDTPQHYYVVTGYDANTGEFEFGASAGVLRRSGGKTKWRPEQLPNLGMGAPRATIYMAGAN